MSKKIPTITEIYENISNDFRNKLNLSDNQLKTVLDAMALSLAGQFKLSYLSLADNLNNVFPDTADSSLNGGTLDRIGRIYLNRGQKPASTGVFRASVIGESGATLRANLTFKSNDESLNPGQLYILNNEFTLSGDNDEIEIRSTRGGVDYNLRVNDTLTITEPIIGAEQIVTILEVIEQPLAAESDDDFRKAILNSIQLEPQGGARTDYRLWASDAQGVRFSYPFVKQGDAGTVQVFVEATESDSTDGFGTPTQAILNEVAEVIEFDPDITKPLNERGRRPIQANIETLPIELNTVDVEIVGLNTDTADIRASIELNIKEYLKSIRPFVAGADLLRNKNSILYIGRLNSVVTDIISSDNFFNDISISVNGVNVTSYEFSRENIPYLRNITFV